MKEKVADTCIKYIKLRAHGKDKEARKLLENLPKEIFRLLYISGLDYLKDVLNDDSSPYILTVMTRQYFMEHFNDDELSDMLPNDLSCYVVEGFIYNLLESFKRNDKFRRVNNPFAEELLKDSDPEVAAVGREILEGRF